MPFVKRHFKVIFPVVLLLSAGWIALSAFLFEPLVSANLSVPHTGFRAPEFELQSLDGSTLSLSDFRGQPVVLNFWASWCPPCKAEMPAFLDAYTQYKSQGLVVIAVNAAEQDTLADASSFVQSKGLTFPILLDTDSRVMRAYQVRALPTTFFIDQDGVIRQVAVGGPLPGALLDAYISSLMEEAP